jgi:glycosyltransferase involved in cell wall biosynthesis
MSEVDLVTVIIPAYNAAVTIDETLLSVRSQTHRKLEILVIDDGSADSTPDIVRAHGRDDSRIRLIQQRNCGVAAARNRGIDEACGELIAPIDADDLWSSQKIEKQLVALHRGGERVGLVYTWFSVIDEDSRIIDQRYRPLDEGNVLDRMCRLNIVGNGSSALMRKTAILEVGGYDPGLRAQFAQGCEDLKLYFRISEIYLFAVVPEYLTGYRLAPTNMSSNVLQMLRSWELVAAEMRARHPDLSADVAAGGDAIARWLFARALEMRRGGDALALAAYLMRRNPVLAAKTTFVHAPRSMLRRLGPMTKRLSGQPDRQNPRFTVGAPVPLRWQEPRMSER